VPHIEGGLRTKFLEVKSSSQELKLAAKSGNLIFLKKLSTVSPSETHERISATIKWHLYLLKIFLFFKRGEIEKQSKRGMVWYCEARAQVGRGSRVVGGPKTQGRCV